MEFRFRASRIFTLDKLKKNMTRNEWYRTFITEFSDDFFKAVDGFSWEEKIFITETLMKIPESENYVLVDEKTAQPIEDVIYKKFGKRLTEYGKINLVQYF